MAADLELQCTDEAVKGSRVYLTEHFIVTSFYRFDVIPYTCIQKKQALEQAGTDIHGQAAQ